MSGDTDLTSTSTPRTSTVAPSRPSSTTDSVSALPHAEDATASEVSKPVFRRFSESDVRHTEGSYKLKAFILVLKGAYALVKSKLFSTGRKGSKIGVGKIRGLEVEMESRPVDGFGQTHGVSQGSESLIQLTKHIDRFVVFTRNDEREDHSKNYKSFKDDLRKVADISCREAHAATRVCSLLDAFEARQGVLSEGDRDKLLSLLDQMNLNCKEGKSCDGMVKDVEKLLLHSLVDASTDNTVVRQVKKSKLLKYTQIKKDFDKEHHIARGKNSPPEMTNGITIWVNGDEQQLSEKTTQHNLGVASSYLASRCRVNPDTLLASSAKTLRGAEGGAQVFRPSQLKKDEELQGVTINGHQHSLSISKGGVDKQVVVQRSGAWAVHGGFKPKASIIKLKSQLDQAKSNFEILSFHDDPKKLAEAEDNLRKFIKEMGVKLPSGLDKAATRAEKIKLYQKAYQAAIQQCEQRLATRRDLAISQGLPKVVQSLSTMAKDEQSLKMALATGSFLHVEESFLSGKDSHEKSMMEDMSATVDYLRENAEVTFEAGLTEPKIKVSDDPNNPTITIILPKPDPPPGQPATALDRPFKLQIAMFNTGINESQVLGSAGGSQDELQIALNTNSLNVMNEYVKDLVSKLPPDNERQAIIEAWDNLENHYKDGSHRDAVDTRGQELRVDLLQAMHAGIGVLCKSGKDRTGEKTGSILARGMSRELAPPKKADAEIQVRDARVFSKPPKPGEKTVSSRKAVEDDLHQQLDRGISYRNTGLNTGKGDGYALNAFQQRFWSRFDRSLTNDGPS